MRAKFINEDFGFERGTGNPTRSLRVGKYSLQTEFKEYVDDMMDYIINNINRIVGFEIKYPIKRDEFGGYFEPDIAAPLLEFLEIVTFEGYPLDVDQTIKDIFNELNFRGLTESVNFERSKDPKNSMNIGAKPAIYDKLKEFFENEIILSGRRSMQSIYSFYPSDGIYYCFTAPVTKKWIEDVVKEYGFDKYLEFPGIDGGERNRRYTVKFKIKEPFIEIFNDISSYKTFIANESLEFERGNDPKTSMGIGQEATYRKIADMMKTDGWTPQDPKDSDSAAGWAVEYGHHDLAKFIIDNDRPSNLGTDLILWAIQNDDAEMVKLILSYNPNLKNSSNYLLNRSSNNEQIYNLIKKYIGSLEESLEFERGKDPKVSLNIGISKYSLENHKFHQYGELIKETIASEMDLFQEEIFFMGDSRDSENMNYIQELSTFITDAKLINRLELESDLPGGYPKSVWVGNIEIFKSDEGKGCIFEGPDHAEFFGDSKLFNYFRTIDILKL